MIKYFVFFLLLSFDLPAQGLLCNFNNCRNREVKLVLDDFCTSVGEHNWLIILHQRKSCSDTIRYTVTSPDNFYVVVDSIPSCYFLYRSNIIYFYSDYAEEKKVNVCEVDSLFSETLNIVGSKEEPLIWENDSVPKLPELVFFGIIDPISYNYYLVGDSFTKTEVLEY